MLIGRFEVCGFTGRERGGDESGCKERTRLEVKAPVGTTLGSLALQLSSTSILISTPFSEYSFASRRSEGCVVDDLATFDNLQPDPLPRAAKKSIQRGSEARKQRSRKQPTRRLRFFAETSFPVSEEEKVNRERNEFSNLLDSQNAISSIAALACPPVDPPALATN